MTERQKEQLLQHVWPGRSPLFYVMLVVVLLLSFLGAHYSESGYRSYLIEFVIETEEPVDFDIYYDVGRGYNEVDRQSMEVEEVGSPVPVRFCIPVWTELEKIRFDPAREHAIMTIYSITIFYDEETTFQVPLETLEPQKDIIYSAYDGGKFTFETDPEGEDPIIVLNRISDKPIGSRWKEPSRYAVWMIGGLLCLLAGRFVLRYFFSGL